MIHYAYSEDEIRRLGRERTVDRERPSETPPPQREALPFRCVDKVAEVYYQRAGDALGDGKICLASNFIHMAANRCQDALERKNSEFARLATEEKSTDNILRLNDLQDLTGRIDSDRGILQYYASQIEPFANTPEAIEEHNPIFSCV